MKEILWKEPVYRHIIRSIASLPPETGGIIGGKGNIVSHFYFDKEGSSDENTYTPHVETLNLVLGEWAENGVGLMGFVHSHALEPKKPSYGDLLYAREILSLNPETLKTLILAIVMVPYRADADSFLVFEVTGEDCVPLEYRLGEGIPESFG